MLNLIFSFLIMIKLTTVMDLILQNSYVEGPAPNVIVLEVEPLGGD